QHHEALLGKKRELIRAQPDLLCVTVRCLIDTQARRNRSGRGEEMESVSWFEPDVFAVGVLGLGGILMGLLEIAAQASLPKHIWSIAASCFAAMLAAFAAGAFQFGQTSRIWVPPLALASLGFALRVARSAWFPSLLHFLLSLARSRR